MDRNFLKVYNWIPESFYKAKIIHFVNIQPHEKHFYIMGFHYFYNAL